MNLDLGCFYSNPTLLSWQRWRNLDGECLSRNQTLLSKQQWMNRNRGTRGTRGGMRRRTRGTRGTRGRTRGRTRGTRGGLGGRMSWAVTRPSEHLTTTRFVQVPAPPLGRHPDALSGLPVHDILCCPRRPDLLYNTGLAGFS